MNYKGVCKNTGSVKKFGDFYIVFFKILGFFVAGGGGGGEGGRGSLSSSDQKTQVMHAMAKTE